MTDTQHSRDETQRLHVDDDGAQGGIFDLLHPPTDELISDCVHCGFCLPTCPTYALWGEEMDSPRGRIYLMKLGKEGAVELDQTYVEHFDACLGCMACVTACPSGVKYDELLEAVRPQIERNYRRGRLDRAFRALIFAMFPYPGRLRVAAAFGFAYQRLGVRALIHRLGVLRLVPKQLQAMEALMPPMRWSNVTARLPGRTAAVGEQRRRVGLVTGCVQRVFFSDVNAATARVLAADGCEVIAPVSQQCCGALSVHAGREPEALARARRLIDEFETQRVELIVANVAGCGSTLKEYGHLLRDDPEYAAKATAFSAKVRDISEVLAEIGPVAVRSPIPARVAYHDACHLAHGQGVRTQPRDALRAIPGIEVTEIPDPEICCGSAGIYNLVQPEPAEALGLRKVASIATVQPDAIATSNPGCLLQIRRYLDDDIPLFHPIELVDAAIRGIDPIRERRGRPPSAGADAGAVERTTVRSEPGRFSPPARA